MGKAHGQQTCHWKAAGGKSRVSAHKAARSVAQSVAEYPLLGLADWTIEQALAIMAQPSCVPVSLGELARLSDEIWFLVGDTAVDPSWYTKRASLSAIYASTELFMTTDHSSGFNETRKFLQRRLAETQELGGTLRSIGTWVGFTASAGLNVLRSKGVRI